MGIARRTLLAISRSKWLAEQFRHRAFARRAVRRFMPGEDAEAALAAAGSLQRQGIDSVLTLLGENVVVAADADGVVRHYETVLDGIERSGLPCQISVKPTQLGLDLDPEGCGGRLERLLARAAERRNFVWIDMESSGYVDRTLELFERALGTSGNVGLCLQSYLRRTADDLDQLLETGAAIRLVKGAYQEPAAVAFRRKERVDAGYLALAGRLLDALAAGRCRPPAFATHDVPLLDRVNAIAEGKGLAPDGFEIQMLYGIRREEQLRLAQSGRHVRVLISYGTEWFPWYVRRLAERPANVGFVLRSLFTR